MKIKKWKIWKFLNELRISEDDKYIRLLLYFLAGIFILLLSFFIIEFGDAVRRRLFPLAGILGLLFLIFGIRLTVLGKKEKDEKLKSFLMLTGVSAIFPFASTILHNFFYAMGIAFENFECFFDSLHGLFFILGLAVAPVLFIAGWIGSFVLLKKKKII